MNLMKIEKIIFIFVIFIFINISVASAITYELDFENTLIPMFPT